MRVRFPASPTFRKRQKAHFRKLPELARFYILRGIFERQCYIGFINYTLIRSQPPSLSLTTLLLLERYFPRE